MRNPKLKASISLDLDDLWTYLKTHGDPGWSDYPSYHHIAVPRILDFLDKQKQKITFFIVAQDAVFDSNKEILGEIANRGHDIGNHSFHHDPWLHLYRPQQMDEEIERAEEHIEKVIGVRTRGFRGPGFSHSADLIKTLIKREYDYDASTFPNILNPLARQYFLMRSPLSRAEKKKRSHLFGSWKDGFRPNKPYYWTENGDKLLEIPVTTMPLFKVPIHASYILYLSIYSKSLSMAYLRFALSLCKLFKVEPSILLHPLDFLGKDDTDRLSFFPAMGVESSKKIDVMEELFAVLMGSFELLDLGEYSRSVNLTAMKKRKLIIETVRA